MLTPTSLPRHNGDKFVRIVYSDEAGIGDERIEPITVVAAIIVEGDHQAFVMEKEIQAIREDLVSAESCHLFEFKGNRLFSRLGSGNNEEILRRFLGLIPKYQIPIAAGAVNRPNIRKHWKSVGIPWSQDNVQNTAFVVCASRVETIMKAMWPMERAIWIADETRAKIQMRLSLQLFQGQPMLPDDPRTHLEHILDTIYIGDSDKSLFIQLADVCNFFIKRHYMGDTSAERFFQIIRPLIADRDAPPIYSTLA